VKELARNSLEYSFLPGQSLFEGRDYKHMRMERALLEFEDHLPEPGLQ
jgi:hypothetical protein